MMAAVCMDVQIKAVITGVFWVNKSTYLLTYLLRKREGKGKERKGRDKTPPPEIHGYGLADIDSKLRTN